jgi:hypothetical protein
VLCGFATLPESPFQLLLMVDGRGRFGFRLGLFLRNVLGFFRDAVLLRFGYIRQPGIERVEIVRRRIFAELPELQRFQILQV